MKAKAKAVGHYPLGYGAVRAFGDARYWADEYLDHGIPEEHGLEPNRPLTAAERRDFETLVRVTGRIFDRDDR